MRLLLTKPALVLAIASLAIGSVVQASVRHHRSHRTPDRPQARFDISGRTLGLLEPGATQAVEVTLANHIRHVLWISGLKLSVRIDPAHAAAGCVAARDFAVSQLPRATYPIRLPARSVYAESWPARLHWPGGHRWRLRQLGVPVLPAVSMLNLPDVDQDGCKGAKLHLHFWATSRLNPPYVRERAAR